MSLSRREIEDLKPEINRIVEKVLGFGESALATAALNCLDKGYDRNKAERKLGSIIEGSQLSRFCSKLYSMYDDYRHHSKHDRTSSRKRKEERHRDPEVEPKKPKKDTIIATEPITEVPAGNPSPGQLTADKIKEVMASAQRDIIARKAQLNLPAAPQRPMVQPNAQQQMLQEKQRKMAELQASIAARLARSSLPIPTAPGAPPLFMPQAPNAAGTIIDPNAEDKGAPATKPTPLILDEQGRTIDATTGEAVQLSTYTPTLKANIRAKKREQFKAQLHERPPEEISETGFFDTRVAVKPAARSNRRFTFHDKGKFEQQATRLRTQARLERLQSEIAQSSKRTGIASAAKLAIISTRRDVKDDTIPNVEWWDVMIIQKDTYDAELKDVHITHLIEHPIQMKPPADPDKEVKIPVMLTARERKKLRRQSRLEAQKDEHEKIRLGLIPPPEPKVRLANLMRVLGSEAVQDPTKVEAHVRAQMEKRLKDHQERNANRKLTKEQKRDKKIRKIQEDTSLGVHVSIYRVCNLSNPSKKFKVETNANQLQMTGIVVLHKDCNVVVVEGGPKQQKKFRRLMLHRIKWHEEAAKGGGGLGAARRAEKESDDEGEDQKKNSCSLVWEGTVMDRAFPEIRFKLCPTEIFAREQFKKSGVEHYWDLAYSGAVMEVSDEEEGA